MNGLINKSMDNKEILQDFISGEKFIDIVDFKYNPQIFEDYNQYPNTFNIDDVNNSNKDIVTVYIHIPWCRYFFQNIDFPKINKKIILVTHNSDNEINADLFNSKPENIIHWYSQNINYQHPDLESIPIGLENKRWFPWKVGKMMDILNKPKSIRNLLYINHNTNNNIVERHKPYELFGNKPWTTAVYGRNGQDFDSYIENVYNHKFIVSPIGNGIDVHRTAEAWYMDTIPLVIKNINNSFYSDLPILYVNDWEEISENFLNQKYEEIQENKRNGVYNMEKLTISFWKKLIRNSRC